jgi:hypothetical protein
MQKDFERLFHRAEDHYLHPLEMVSFHKHLGLLEHRLSTYRYLRDNEGMIFQSVADQLESEFPEAPAAQLEQALLHWISILRYGSMGMLLSNPEYLQYRLLEWLSEVVSAYELQEIEKRISEILVQNLQSVLAEEDFHLLEPFLKQADTTVLHQTAPQAPEYAMAGESA